MVVLAHRFQYRFDKYYLHVNGNFSKISIGNDKTTKVELHNTGSNEERFNKALSFLVDCLNSFVKNLD